MAKSKTVRVSDEELEMLQALRKSKLEPSVDTVSEESAPGVTDGQKALADAFVSAIERTRPPDKKTPFNRKRNTPWTPKNGAPELKLKRKVFHHGIPIMGRVSNEEIELMNKIKPGGYCDGFVRVTVRKDRGLDIDYPVKTNSQRLRLINQFGIRSFTELLQRITDEQANPTKYRKAEDSDLYE